MLWLSCWSVPRFRARAQGCRELLSHLPQRALSLQHPQPTPTTEKHQHEPASSITSAGSKRFFTSSHPHHHLPIYVTSADRASTCQLAQSLHAKTRLGGQHHSQKRATVLLPFEVELAYLGRSSAELSTASLQYLALKSLLSRGLPDFSKPTTLHTRSCLPSLIRPSTPSWASASLPDRSAEERPGVQVVVRPHVLRPPPPPHQPAESRRAPEPRELLPRPLLSWRPRLETARSSSATCHRM